MNKFSNGLPIIIRDNEIIPLYLTEDDQPWLQKMVYEFSRFENQSVLNWKSFLKMGLNFKYPFNKGRFALLFIESELTNIIESPQELSEIKIKLFLKSSEIRKENETTIDNHSLLSQQSNKKWDRNEIIKATLRDYPRVSFEQLEKCLSRGTGNEKNFKQINTLGDPNELRRKINGFLVKKLMMKAILIEIILKDQSRRIVRQAKLQGLICEIRKKDKSHIHLRISGPLSLFGPTTIYGRKLQAFIPLLFWNLEFRLRATFRSQGHSYFFYLDSLSPLKTSKPPSFFDSKLEETFYLELGKHTQLWDLIREPEPIVIENRMFFPDFALINKTFKIEIIYIEIIGYWTNAYIKKKLEEVTFMNNMKVIFIVNSKQIDMIKKSGVSENKNHQWVYFKRKIFIKEVLIAVKNLTSHQL